MFIDRWIKCDICIQWNIIQALKRSGILSHATTWMILEDIILSEIIQTQKDKYCMRPLI